MSADKITISEYSDEAVAAIEQEIGGTKGIIKGVDENTGQLVCIHDLKIYDCDECFNEWIERTK